MNQVQKLPVISGEVKSFHWDDPSV